MQSEGVPELKILQDESAHLKRLVAELSLDKTIVQDVASKSGAAKLKRALADYIIVHYRLRLARACRLIKQVGSTQYCRARRAKLALHQRLRELAQVRVRWATGACTYCSSAKVFNWASSRPTAGIAWSSGSCSSSERARWPARRAYSHVGRMTHRAWILYRTNSQTERKYDC